MARQAFFSLSLVLVLLFHCTTTLAQPAQAPAKPAVAPTKPAKAPSKAPAKPAAAPTLPADAPVQPADAPTPSAATIDIIKILQKVHQFAVFIRLLKGTKVAEQLNAGTGYTIFAPTDKAFSALKAGTINSLSDLQKTQLIQFHILATVVSMSNFQTLSNPVPTQAGDSGAGEFPLYVASSGNQVKLSTGLVNTTVGRTIYFDNQLAIYQVDKVLLPQFIFSNKSPVSAPALSPSKPETENTPADNVNTSGAVCLTSWHGILVSSFGVALIAAFAL